MNYEERKMVLSDGKTIFLNDQQWDAYQSMIDWFNSEDEYLYTLEGFAGTGKTTIVKKFIDVLPYGVRVFVSAPTHKAKNVISKTTGKAALTIQSLLGLRPNIELENFDINNPQFDKKGEPRIKDCNLLVLDEASMQNKDLFTYTIREARNHNVKVLFMGDSAQLPPVNEKKSLVFTSPKIDRRVLLSKVERQADGNPLMRVYDLIRSDINSEVDLFDHNTLINDKGEGIEFITNENEFKRIVIDHFKNISNDPNKYKLLAWTNREVKKWNEIIRNSIFDTKEYIVEGEFLMAYNNIGYGSNIIIENSADYIIHNVSKSVSYHRVDVEDDSRIGIDVYVCKIALANLRTPYGRIVNIVIPNEENYLRFLRVHDIYLKSARAAKDSTTRKSKWREYYLFKDNHLLIHDIKKNGKLQVSKDLDYGYSITVHKSQGSTYDTVFVHESDIDRNKNTKERNNLKYVAFSRPSKKAYVFTSKVSIFEDNNDNTVDKTNRRKVIKYLESNLYRLNEKQIEMLERNVEKFIITCININSNNIE